MARSLEIYQQLIDPYLEFIRAEGLPVVESFGIDLLGVETRPWARMGAVTGSYVHTSGRGDFLDMYVMDIPPARATDPQKHLYEEVIYVLDGRGSTTIEASDGSCHSFEWGPRGVFALPLNARYQHFNTSGQRMARLAGVTNLPMVLNAFHNQAFIFDNPFAFPERLGEQNYFKGDGTFLPVRPGRHMWQTNFVPDVRSFQLVDWSERGTSTNMNFRLGNNTQIAAHISELMPWAYAKAAPI